MSKQTNYERHIKTKLKNKKFKEAFEEEKRRLEIAYEILQMRKKQRLSQSDLAKKIGTTQSAIARMEAGKQNFTTDTLQKVAYAFNRSLKVEFTK